MVDSGGEAGEWLLDPEDIVIDEGMAASIEGTLNEGGNVTVKTAEQGDGEGNITVAASITKTDGDDASLTLDAHNNIDVNAPITSESNKLDVTLKAGGSVDVNAEIATNGGHFATIISAASDTTGLEESSGDLNSDEQSEVAPADPGVVVAVASSEESESVDSEGEESASTDEAEQADQLISQRWA